MRLISNVADQIRGITLADNEQSLIFLGTYGNHIYSSIRPAAGSCKIIFGDGGETVLPYSVPRDTYCNGVLCKVSTTDGSEKFSSYLSYGSNISTDPNYFLYFDAMYANAAGDIFVTGEIGTPHDQFIYKYNSAGTRIDSKRHADQSSYDLHVQNISRNQNTSGFYTYEVSGKGVGQYDSRITKINPTDLSKTYLSHISRGVYGGPSVIPQSMDVNNAETHLFLTGTVAGEFSIQSTGQPINWKGGNDGVIICFDPQNANAAGNIRWMVNLNSGGNESVTSCKFDETAQVLRVTGYLGTNEVDFNPLGTAMKRKSPLSNSIFYAVYDLNGICQHVDMLGTTFGSEIGYALDVAGTNMSLFGTFDVSPFQADPSKRLDPLRTT